MKYPWLFVGAKVVCVDDRGVIVIGRPPCAPLVKGAIYTVAGVFEDPDDGTGVRLFEQRNMSRFGPEDIGFRASRFRPLIDTTRTVEALRKLTLNLPKRIDA